MDNLLTNVYTAGLFDGEGTITLSYERSAEKYRHPHVSVSSTSYEFMVFLKENYKGHISSKRVYREHHKQSWSWRVSNFDAVQFIEKIEPYLKDASKKYRASLVLKEYPKFTKRNGKYTPEEILLKKDFEYRFFNCGPDGLNLKTNILKVF